jgi:hypothetical protein
MMRAAFRLTPSASHSKASNAARAFTRLVTLLVPMAAACSDSSAPTASADADALANVATVQTALQGVTLESLQNANWDCQQRVPGRIACAPPGIGLPPIPPLGQNGRPVHKVFVFLLDGTPVGSAIFLRPDLYHGQTCVFTEQPFVFRPIIGYYECFRAY